VPLPVFGSIPQDDQDNLWPHLQVSEIILWILLEYSLPPLTTRLIFFYLKISAKYS
jgi:hypothetical protein